MSCGNSKAHRNSWVGYCRLSYYKHKKLGHLSEKVVGGDTPCAGWCVVLFEIIFPVVMAIVSVITYLFVESFLMIEGRRNASLLVWIAIVLLGPIIWNTVVLLVQFLVALFIGLMMESYCMKFGSIVVSIVHVFTLVGMDGFFKSLVHLFLFFSMVEFSPHAVC